MYCTNHPDRSAHSACAGCARMFCRECLFAGGDDAMSCSKCEALKASRNVSLYAVREHEAAQARGEEQKRQRKIRQQKIRTVQIGVIVVAVILAFIQVPNMYAEFQPPVPLRVCEFNADDSINECVTVLWQVSKKLQKGELPGAELFCAVGNKKFEIIKKPKGDIVVRVSQPELYGLSEMRVSRLHPVPEVIK